MSEAEAASANGRKQRWAEPGSRHDRLVGLLKVALPARSAC
jgi:hypothetical protein